MLCGMLITSPLLRSLSVCARSRPRQGTLACAYSDDFISSSDTRLIRCIDAQRAGSDALHTGNERTFGLQRHASSMLALLCVVVRDATQSHKRDHWSNKLDRRRCFYNDCCCIDSSRSSGALSITLRRRGEGEERSHCCSAADLSWLHYRACHRHRGRRRHRPSASARLLCTNSRSGGGRTTTSCGEAGPTEG